MKTIKQCIDTVTTDAYGDEVVSSWENCLEEVFENVEADLITPVRRRECCQDMRKIWIFLRRSRKKCAEAMPCASVSTFFEDDEVKSQIFP